MVRRGLSKRRRHRDGRDDYEDMHDHDMEDGGGDGGDENQDGDDAHPPTVDGGADAVDAISVEYAQISCTDWKTLRTSTSTTTTTTYDRCLAFATTCDDGDGIMLPKLFCDAYHHDGDDFDVDDRIEGGDGTNDDAEDADVNADHDADEGQ